MMARALLLALLLTASAAAQQRPVFDPDDFIDPRDHDRPLYSLRVVMGGAWNFIDDYRPVGQDTGFVQVTNGIYWNHFEFDYKHSEVRGDDNGPPVVTKCGCSPPIFFPTPRPEDATPAAPLPGSKDTLQVAFYNTIRRGASAPPLKLRYRLSWSRQEIETVIVSPIAETEDQRLHGREQSFGLDADTWLPIFGYDIFGSLQFARTTRTGTADNRSQSEFTYTNRFPARAFARPRVIVRTMLTVGGITDRGGTAINLVNPYFEAFYRPRSSRVNFHLVWSPQLTNSGLEGWSTTHQVAVFADWGLLVPFKQ